MSERKNGWYWCRLESRWRPALWQGGAWVLPRFASGDEDDDGWCEVGPRIPAPDEPWRLVPVEATPLMAGNIKRHMDNHGDGAIAWVAALLAAPKP